MSEITKIVSRFVEESEDARGTHTKLMTGLYDEQSTDFGAVLDGGLVEVFKRLGGDDPDRPGPAEVDQAEQQRVPSSEPVESAEVKQAAPAGD